MDTLWIQVSRREFERESRVSTEHEQPPCERVRTRGDSCLGHCRRVLKGTIVRGKRELEAIDAGHRPVHELVHHLLPQRPRCDSHFHGQDAKRDGDDRGGDEGHAHEAEGECEECEDLEAESAASLSDAEPERPRDRTAAAAAASEETAALLRDLHALEPVREDDESGLSQSATPRRPPRHPDERALSPSRRLASDEQDAHSFDHDESSATARVSSSVDLRRTLATRQPAPLPAP